MRSGVVSIGLALVGAVGLLYPAVVLGFTIAEPYELEIMRWTGLSLLATAPMWLWATRRGGSQARRLSRWVRTATIASLLFVLTTNPIFLLVAFSLVVAGLLDAMLERGTLAAFELMARLQGDEV